MKQRFEGQVILVTGAASGMGAAEAAAFAREGGRVVVADVADDAGQRIAAEIENAGGRAKYLHLDVTSRDAWDEAAAKIREDFGKLNVLVNNAGINSKGALPFLEEAELDRTIAVDVKGPLFGIQAAAPLMRESGGGSIVNIGSTVGLGGHVLGAYCIAKWALRGVTKSAAVSLSGWGIRVNTVCPGGVVTPMTEHLPMVQGMSRATPLGRCGTLSEIAAAVLFLASSEASYLTGIDLPVDGGFTDLGAYGQMMDGIGLKKALGL